MTPRTAVAIAILSTVGPLAGRPAAAIESAAAAAAVDFSRDVKPILTEHCLKCHGNDEPEADLNLNDRDIATRPAVSGLRAVVPGDAARSELVRRILSTDAETRMPPGDEKPISAREIDVLRRWIDAGAEYQVHWSFRPLRRPPVPAVTAARVRNPIDAFVMESLGRRGIEPAAEADPHALLKRVSLDLTGLLPTWEEAEAFARDYADPASRERAYEAVVDRLLASPHFGERWGRHWLDLARYADSDGYEKDNARPDAYVYRDWVMQAFNDDMPFDRFTLEQLAGDLLPEASARQKIATAFNRQTLTNTEGGVDQEEFRIAACMDRTDTIGAVWLGLTMGCAKCHTHKYDPIAHTEYYRLFAFFNAADEVVQKLTVQARNPDAHAAALRPLEERLDARHRAILPSEQAWEEAQTRLVNTVAATPLVIEDRDVVAEVSTASGTRFERQGDGSFLAVSGTGATAPPAVDTTTILLTNLPAELSGLRLETVCDPTLPKGSAGRSASGNFVVTRFRAEVVDAAGGRLRDVPLQRATADFQQTGFKADDAIATATNPKKGWAVVPQVDKPHWLQARTLEPITLADGERLRVVIEQQFGTGHLLGRFRIRSVTGDTRDLHLPPDIVTGLKLYPEKRTYQVRQRIFDFFAAQDPQVREIQAEIAAVNRKHDVKEMPVRMIAAARTSRATRRLDRGDFLSPQEQVEPGGLAVLPPLQASGTAATRLDLARWLTGRDNPLTPRVIANQFWARLFGAGIVRSIGDFGTRGELPTHPELLDWLAITLRDDLRWSLKRYLKTILMSSTYRQSSAHRPELVDIDPLNTLLARQNRLRVEAEIVRDLTLQVGGLLSPKVGGPSVFPAMPADLAKLSYANNFSWSESKGEDRYRRGMYTFFKRTIPHPSLMTFDCPDANLTCVVRSVSNTPLQALTLLNNEAFVESAQALARDLLALEGLGDEPRLRAAIRRCLVRDPRSDEIDRLRALLDHAREFYEADAAAAEALAGQYAVPPTTAAEAAAWIATVRVLMNLDEFITRE